MSVHSVDQSVGLSIWSLCPTVCLLTHHLSVCPFRISLFHASLCLSVCQSVYLSVRPYLPIFTSIQSICPSIGLSIHPAACPSVHPFIRLSVIKSVNPSICPLFHLSVSSIHLSVCPFVQSLSPVHQLHPSNHLSF